MGNNLSTSNTSNEQSECERNLGNNPALKPLCNPEFLTKVKIFFDDLKTVDDKQKSLDVKEAEIINLVSTAEKLDKYYRETSNLLSMRERQLENKLRQMGLMSNDARQNNIPIKLLDSSYNELVNEYDTFINDLEKINDNSKSLNVNVPSISPVIPRGSYPIYQPQLNLNTIKPQSTKSFTPPPTSYYSQVSTSSNLVNPPTTPSPSTSYNFQTVKMNSYKTSGGPEKTKMSEVNGANIIPYTNKNGTPLFLLGFDPNESIWKAFGGKKDINNDKTVRSIAKRETMEESSKYDPLNHRYKTNTSFLPLKSIAHSLKQGNGVVIPKYDRQKTQLWNNFYFIEIDLNEWKRLTNKYQGNVNGLSDIKINGIEDNEVNRIRWFNNSDIYGSNNFRIHPPLSAIFRDHYNDLITKL